MQCPHPDKLSEFAFEGVSEVPGADALLSHLRMCPSCASIYAEWQSIVAAVRSAFAIKSATPTCLEDNTFAAYVDGTLPDVERDAAEQHLATCARCLRQLCELHTVLVEAMQPVRTHVLVLEWLRDGIRSLESQVEAFRPVALMPVPVLRGAEAAQALAWEAEQDGYVLRLTVQQASAQQFTLHLLLQLDGIPQPRQRVLVRTGGALVESRLTGMDGTVTLYSLDLTDYDIELQLPERPLVFRLVFTPGT